MSKKGLSINLNPFKHAKFTWWQMGLFKSAAVSFGILLGIYFFSFLSMYTTFFWVIFAVSSSIFIYYWAKQ